MISLILLSVPSYLNENYETYLEIGEVAILPLSKNSLNFFGERVVISLADQGINQEDSGQNKLCSLKRRNLSIVAGVMKKEGECGHLA